jgi:hypothetical protein
MPTRHHYGYWITAEGEHGHGDLLFIDPFDLSPQREERLKTLLNQQDFEKTFELVRSLIQR